MQLDIFSSRYSFSPSILEGSKVSHISQVDLSSLQHRLVLRYIDKLAGIAGRGCVGGQQLNIGHADTVVSRWPT